MRSHLPPYRLMAFFASSIAPMIRHAVVLATASPIAATFLEPSISVHEGFLSRKEIDTLLGGAVELMSKMNGDSIDTYFSPINLPRGIVDRLLDLGGTCGEWVGEDKVQGTAPVMTMLMTATTDRHKDCHVPQSEGKVVNDDVSFVFLESNAEARFEHGDTQVPVVAGNLVKFRGSIPHRTIVPPGSRVRIAGPFHLRSLEYVGSCPVECDDVSDCDGGDFYSRCECQSMRRIRQLQAKERAMDGLKELKYWDGFLRNVARERELDEMCLCKEAIGACLKPDGSCEENMVLAECVRGCWGTFMGGDSTCDDSVDESVGEPAPCCYHDRQCMEFQEGYCEMMTPGHFLGAGKTCDDCPSMDSYGACCFETDCKELPQIECENRAGVFKGIYSTCNDDCLGACCSSSDCKIVTETGKNTTCIGTGAVFGGAGTDCMPDGCPTKCVETLRLAPTIPFPQQQGDISTVSGNSAATGEDFKDNFPECDATILPSKSLWYNLNNDLSSFTDREVIVSTCENDVQGASSSYQSSLTVQEGNCAGLECVGSNENSVNCKNGKGATVRFCAVWGIEYHILVHGFDDYCMMASGEFTLAVRDDGPCNIDPEESTSTTTTTTTTTTEEYIDPEDSTTSTTTTTTTEEFIDPEDSTTTTTTEEYIDPEDSTTSTTTYKPHTTTSTTKGDPVIGDCEHLPPGCHKPCYERISGFEAYQPYCPWAPNAYDPSKYFHCDNWGGCVVKECCEEGTYWNDALKACAAPAPPSDPDPVVGDCEHLPPGCDKPCHIGMVGFAAYQPFCPWTAYYEPSKYFHCDNWGGCQVKKCCVEGTYWDDHVKQCH